MIKATVAAPPQLPVAHLGAALNPRNAVRLIVPPMGSILLSSYFRGGARQNCLVLTRISHDGAAHYQLSGHGGGAEPDVSEFTLKNDIDEYQAWLVSSWEIFSGDSWGSLTHQGVLAQQQQDGCADGSCKFNSSGGGLPDGWQISSLTYTTYVAAYPRPTLPWQSANADQALALQIPPFGVISLKCALWAVRRAYTVCLTVGAQHDTYFDSWRIADFDIGHPATILKAAYINRGPEPQLLYLTAWEMPEGTPPGPLTNQASIQPGPPQEIPDTGICQFFSVIADAALPAGRMLADVSYAITEDLPDPPSL
jgi:hypothetical protein